MGFNCAEAINFATPDWINAGKAALRCKCHGDSVHISMSLFDPSWSGVSVVQCDLECQGKSGSGLIAVNLDKNMMMFEYILACRFIIIIERFIIYFNLSG